MTPAPPSSAGAEGSESRPYKGQESYQAEDAEFFYGRDRDAAQLTARILSARMTVLHAASGAGKTSLLNARIIPSLEAKGWIPVYARPNENPIESVRLATLRSLFPPPDTEIAALDRATRALAVRDDEPLSELLRRYDNAHRTERRRLVAPVASASPPGGAPVPAFSRVTPYLCRLLRRTIELPAFSSHLQAIQQCSAGAMSAQAGVSDGTSIEATRRLLQGPELGRAYHDLLGELYIPVPGLRPFFENLVGTYGLRVPNFSLVLIIDQFEELFTLFVDRGRTAEEAPARQRDWRLRPLFFQELEQLYATGASPAPADPGSADPNDLVIRNLPIRYVISLREEYLAHLDPIRLFAPEVNDASYRLGLLQSEDARTAVREPLAHYSYAYPDGAVDEVIDELAVEGGRLIEPSQLQIVCDKLWERNRELRPEAAVASSDPAVLDIPERTAAGSAAADHGPRRWVRQLLDSFLPDELNGIATGFVKTAGSAEADEQSVRWELLDILSMLVSPSQTRSIVEERTLVSIRFRNERWRRRLVEDLNRRRVVRRDFRLGSTFCEISHEFLIRSIQALDSEELKLHPDTYGRLGFGLDSLKSIERGGLPVLSAEAFRVLHANRRRLVFKPWAAAVMFRTAVAVGDRQAMAEWATRYSSEQMPSAGDLLYLLATAEERLFGIDELRVIDRDRDRLPPAGDPEHRARLERVVKSLVVAAVGDDQESIRYWTRKLTHADP